MKTEVIIAGYGREDAETHRVIYRRLAQWYATAETLPAKVGKPQFFYNEANRVPRFIVEAKFERA